MKSFLNMRESLMLEDGKVRDATLTVTTEGKVELNIGTRMGSSGHEGCRRLEGRFEKFWSREELHEFMKHEIVLVYEEVMALCDHARDNQAAIINLLEIEPAASPA